MRGSDRRTGELFSYVDLEARVRADHPLRVIRAVANEALDAMSGDFASLYAGIGRPSIADGNEPPAGDGGRNADANFRGEKRSNEPQASTSDPDARLSRKADGQPSQLCCMGGAGQGPRQAEPGGVASGGVR